MALCPYCDEDVEVESPELGDEVQCPGCEIALKITSVDPLEFEEIGFDDGDDEDDEEDDNDEFDDDIDTDDEHDDEPDELGYDETEV